MQIQEITKKWGKHIVAILLFAALSAIYFAPAVFDGKVIRQGDMDRYVGMVGGNQMDQYAKNAQPGEFSAWSDAMFGGMPYTSGYGNPAPSLPSFKIIETPERRIRFGDFVCRASGTDDRGAQGVSFGDRLRGRRDVFRL